VRAERLIGWASVDVLSIGVQRPYTRTVETKEGPVTENGIEIVAKRFLHGRSDYTPLPDGNNPGCYLPPVDIYLEKDIAPNGEGLLIVAKTPDGVLRDSSGIPINPGAIAPMK
jgi:hypothetical protein